MSSSTTPRKSPSRGQVWQVGLDPTKGREQAGSRPALVVSVDRFNQGPAELAIVIPITGTNKNVRSHVFVARGEAGLDKDSYIKVEDIRSISTERLQYLRGSVEPATMQQVEQILRVLLKL